MRPAVALFGGEGRLAVELAGGLADLGHPVALLSTTAGNVTDAVIPCDAVSGRDVAAALHTASQRVGRVSFVVDATPAGAAGTCVDLAELDGAGWAARTEEPLRGALHRMQGVHLHLRTGGGRLLVLLPSLALSGAAGLVPWVTASEGRRALVKVAARAWGTDGVLVNCVLVPGALMADGDGGALDRPGLPPAALGRVPALRDEVTRTVSGLLSDDLGAITGQTIAVDGGVWMTP